MLLLALSVIYVLLLALYYHKNIRIVLNCKSPEPFHPIDAPEFKCMRTKSVVT